APTRRKSPRRSARYRPRRGRPGRRATRSPRARARPGRRPAPAVARRRFRLRRTLPPREPPPLRRPPPPPPRRIPPPAPAGAAADARSRRESIVLSPARFGTALQPDPRGNFLIAVAAGEIVAAHATTTGGPTGRRFTGRTAAEVYGAILGADLVSRLDHAAYL